MIKWETILSTADDKLTLLEWLKMVEKAINDGALAGISVQQSDASHATITFSFAGDPEQSFTITLPQGAQGEKGEPGTPGADGTDGTNGRDALVQNRALMSANITSPMAIPNEALNRTAVVGEPMVMFATDTTENKSYMLIGTITSVGNDANPYTFITYSSKVDVTGKQGETGATGDPGTDLFNDFTSLKIDTTDATVSYVSPTAHIAGARLIGYKSSGNEEVECAVDIPIKAGENVTVDASADGKSIEVSAEAGGGSSDITYIHNVTLSQTFSNQVCFSIAKKNNNTPFTFESVYGSLAVGRYLVGEGARKGATGVWNNKTVYSIQSSMLNASITLYYTDGTSEEITSSTPPSVTDIIEPF